MDNALQQVSAELLKVVKEDVIVGTEFLKKQFPDLCEQIIRWIYTSNIIEITLSSIFLILCTILAKKTLKKLKEDEYNDGWIVGVILSLVGVIFSIIFLIDGLLGLTKIIVAPKIALISYVTHLLK